MTTQEATAAAVNDAGPEQPKPMDTDDRKGSSRRSSSSNSSRDVSTRALKKSLQSLREDHEEQGR